MNCISFEWDKNKAQKNIEKHGITFEEASTVFNDADGILFDNPDHSEDEDRFVFLGMSADTNLLIVCHCYRNGDDIIRIISARKATKSETNTYNTFGKGR